MSNDPRVDAYIAAAGAFARPILIHLRATPKPEAEVPPALAEAPAGDAVASAIVSAFSARCRREYREWIAEAKRPETRVRRVGEAIAMLREGKRRNWKYETC